MKALRSRPNAIVPVALAIVTLAGCAHANRHPHWLRIADGAGDVASLNPHLTMGATTDHLAQLTMGYLVRFGPGGKPVPELATEIPSPSNGGVSRDGLHITWHLRRGVRWSDGAPFDARDVAFSTRAILNTSNNEAEGTEGWNAIASIRTPDPYTVVYDLKRPYGALISMSFVTVGGGPCLLPEHILGGLPNINRAAYNAKPVGIGPFRITAWKRGDSVEMEANPYYFRGRPKLDRITFKLISSRETLLAQMRAGEVDLWPLAPPTYLPQLATIPGIHAGDTAMLRTTHLDFFVPHVPDVRVRRAIRLAIDRPHLVRTVEHGYGLVSDRIVWPRNTVDRDDPQAIAYAPERARSLLEAAGWRVGSDGIRVRGGQRLSLAVAYQSGAPDLDRLVEVMRAELRAVGVEILTRTYAHNLLFAQPSDGGILANGRFDLALYSSTITSVPDLASGLSCATIPPLGENYGHYCEPAIDALAARMRATSDPREVDRLFAELDRRFIDDASSIELFVWKGGNAVSDAVHGYRSNALTSFDQMMQTDI